MSDGGRILHRQGPRYCASCAGVSLHRFAPGPSGYGALSRLRLVLFAGEVFPIKHLRNLRRILPRPQMANLYGPTETNVCTWYEVGHIPEDQTIPVPIGKACTNMGVIAIDKAGRRIVA